MSIRRTIKNVKKFLGKANEEAIRLGVQADPRNSRRFVLGWLKNGKRASN